jgi:hypothetical protein
VELVCPRPGAGAAIPAIGTASIAPRTIAAVLMLRIFSSLLFLVAGYTVLLSALDLKET